MKKLISMVRIGFKQQIVLCFKNISTVCDTLFICNLSISGLDILRFQVIAQAHFKDFTEFLVSWKYSEVAKNICYSWARDLEKYMVLWQTLFASDKNYCFVFLKPALNDQNNVLLCELWFAGALEWQSLSLTMSSSKDSKNVIKLSFWLTNWQAYQVNLKLV